MNDGDNKRPTLVIEEDAEVSSNELPVEETVESSNEEVEKQETEENNTDEVSTFDVPPMDILGMENSSEEETESKDEEPIESTTSEVEERLETSNNEENDSEVESNEEVENQGDNEEHQEIESTKEEEIPEEVSGETTEEPAAETVSEEIINVENQEGSDINPSEEAEEPIESNSISNTNIDDDKTINIELEDIQEISKEESKEESPVNDETLNEPNNKKGSLVPIIIIVLLVIVVGFGIYIFINISGNKENKNNNNNKVVKKVEISNDTATVDKYTINNEENKINVNDILLSKDYKDFYYLSSSGLLLMLCEDGIATFDGTNEVTYKVEGKLTYEVKNDTVYITEDNTENVDNKFEKVCQSDLYFDKEYPTVFTYTIDLTKNVVKIENKKTIKSINREDLEKKYCYGLEQVVKKCSGKNELTIQDYVIMTTENFVDINGNTFETDSKVKDIYYVMVNNSLVFMTEDNSAFIYNGTNFERLCRGSEVIKSKIRGNSLIVVTKENKKEVKKVYNLTKDTIDKNSFVTEE